ncbi:glycoside hydrolase family 29 protein [Coniophora puteana RWD-64-598 SS2]|uniref:alpha-L-fucosidase n=1 Tax=Coniophora puteana (strain RWD-64-598) TaxID=741705 RepID=A0A5M3MC39_CONPW|nr:glycoside hydrolase family 29 protein [Coniophora puteana RWD-64-598 SS2]EIW76474.1 glycoside hydrolase family 29 protein [Coniophora puteana RWD-64-598 SS2]
MSIQQPFPPPSTSPIHPFPSTPIPISSLYNNQAGSLGNGTTNANFDGQGGSYVIEFLPNGTWVYDCVGYELPYTWGTSDDNILADGHTIAFEQPFLAHELHFLYAGDGNQGTTVVNFTLHYEDNSSQILPMSVKHWWTEIFLNAGAIETPIHYDNYGKDINGNRTSIYQWSTPIPSQSRLAAVQLPPGTSSDRLHLFALSATPVACQTDNGPALAFRRVRLTSRWELVNGTRAQAVEVTLANLTPVTAFETASITTPLKVTVSGPSFSTVRPGIIYRLTAADQVRVDVLVENLTQMESNELTVVVEDESGQVVASSSGWRAMSRREEFATSDQALEHHETPTWWNNAKFGIFIHWGPYSVPAWGPTWTYPAWYDWQLHVNPGPDNVFWEYHLKTFGKNVTYDDFFANLTASKFNASEWLDLFDDAGAKYFVFVTKHHDGFALFDTGDTSNRNSLYYGPKRDLVKELLDTAKKEKPHLHRGTYFSMPEWFNPDWAPYGIENWPGGLAHNPYIQSELEPYTGRVPVENYLSDLQLPQMLDLAEKYETEIMWCDISSANLTREFAARFFENAWNQGRQVVMNDRCGDLPGHDTPEYEKLVATQPTRKWETSEGMDPHAYAYNRATPPSAYKNGTTIVRNLVDIVSKNGNYLLGVGPTAEGEIIGNMQKNLRDAGRWLGYAGDCVYSTDFWFRGSEDHTGTIRFLTTPKAFCIVSFERPRNGQLVVQDRVPIIDGDTISLLGPGTSNTERTDLHWSVQNGTGWLAIDVPEENVDRVEYAWAFRVNYKQN